MVTNISGVILAGGASKRFGGIHSAMKESQWTKTFFVNFISVKIKIP